MSSLSQVWALPAALLTITNISATWYNLVSKHVPLPYLDEFFHVPQAQRYCNNDPAWDPKITTPPGLYLVSLLFRPVAGCATSSLRALNVGAIALICLVTYHILRYHHRPRSTIAGTDSDEIKQQHADANNQTSLYDAHSALNISLFPPLFFFSALYYTDVMSTLAVLLSYHVYLTQRNMPRDLMHGIRIVVVGVFAMLFRQTNVFWVAVFPAGLTVVDILATKQENTVCTESSARNKFQSAWSRGQVYDVSVGEAGPQDFALFCLTIASAAVRKPLCILQAIAPYLIVLVLFTGFVAWNGSVVLGDKTAHVATIHLPQMLYLWPYVIFFSLPLTLNSVLSPIVMRLPHGPKAFCLEHLTGEPDQATPNVFSTTLFLLCGLAAVHFNTIVHPYTLADNRHYVFYVFRNLLRHPAIIYIVVPFYFIFAWMTVRTLASPTVSMAQEKNDIQEKRSTKSDASFDSCKVSFTVVWIMTTLLSVATAPLVEPRYFIIPWIMWRLRVPYLLRSGSYEPRKKASYDVRIILETLWLLFINVITGYVFLYRGFSWPNESGVQRFLW